MTDVTSTESPLEAVGDRTGKQAIEAFELLGNEMRLAILLALWDAFDPFAEDTWDPTEGNTVPFSTLRERLGQPDSGQFNYHLGKLEGTFVTKTPAGYQLLPAGRELVQAVNRGRGIDEVSLPQTEIDLACPRCDAPTAVTYQNHRLYHVCTACDGYHPLGGEHPSGALSANLTNPAALRDRTPEGIHTARQTHMFHEQAMQNAGICAVCSGPAETTLHICKAHAPRDDGLCSTCDRAVKCAVRQDCPLCKMAVEASVQEFGLHHPAVIAFYWDHGIELGLHTRQTAKVATNINETADQELVSEDPPRVTVTFRHEEDTLQLTYDEELDVIAVGEGD